MDDVNLDNEIFLLGSFNKNLEKSVFLKKTKV